MITNKTKYIKWKHYIYNIVMNQILTPFYQSLKQELFNFRAH